jgi:hypothetical protein
MVKGLEWRTGMNEVTPLLGSNQSNADMSGASMIHDRCLSTACPTQHTLDSTD